MDLNVYFDAELDEHETVVEATRALKAGFLVRLAEVSEAAINAGNKLVFFGNGGSAGDAQHLATELVCRYKVKRKALPAIAFTTDTSLLAANDFLASGWCLPARSRPFANLATSPSGLLRRARAQMLHLRWKPRAIWTWCLPHSPARTGTTCGSCRSDADRPVEYDRADPVKMTSHWDRCCATFLNRGAPDMNASIPDQVSLLTSARVVCVGDVMPTVSYGHVTRVSPEAPIPVCRVQNETAMLGGAARSP